jgi:hypothetical protein
MERTYQDYFETAKRIEKPKFEMSEMFLPSLIVAILFAMWVGLSTLDPWNVQVDGIIALISVTLSISIVVYMSRLWLKKARSKGERFERKIDEIETAKPGFRKFYNAYETAENDKRAERLTYIVAQIVGIVGASAAGAVRSGVQAASRSPNYTGAHLTGISNTLNDIKKKLD